MSMPQDNFDVDPYDDDIYLAGNVKTTPVHVIISGDETRPWRDTGSELAVTPLDIYSPAYSGSGNLVMNGPAFGWYWDVHLITVAGFTAGSVNLWKNDLVTPAAEKFPFTSAGSLTLGKGQFVVLPNDVLYFVPSSITGTISVCLSVEKVRREAWQDYI
jgi:hypothetical protein